MEIVRLRATLDDGSKIAFSIPKLNMDRILASLLKGANGGPDNYILPDKAQREKAADKEPKQRPKLAQIQTYLERMEICKGCPNARDECGWTICKLCGCPMNHVNMIANSKCKDNENPKFGREILKKEASVNTSA